MIPGVLPPNNLTPTHPEQSASDWRAPEARDGGGQLLLDERLLLFYPIIRMDG